MRGSGSTYKVRGAQERVLPEPLRATQRELRSELRKAKERLRQKRHVILGCIRQPGSETEASVKRQVLPTDNKKAAS